MDFCSLALPQIRASGAAMLIDRSVTASATLLRCEGVYFHVALGREYCIEANDICL